MFNLFPKKKSVDEIIEDTDVTPSWEWKPTQTPSMLQAQNDIIDNLIKENNNLRDTLKSIEEDGTEEHNNAIKLRQSIAHLRLEAEKFYKENAELKGELETVELEFNLVLEINNDLSKKLIGLNHLKEENVKLKEQLDEVKTINYNLFKAVDEHKAEKEKLELRLVAYQKMTEGASSSIAELTKEVRGLRHLKEENVQLMDRVNEIDSDMNKEYQAEIFTLRNDIAVLKARNAELLKNNNRLTVDYNGVLHNGGLRYMEAKYQILDHNYQGCTRYRDEYKHQLNAANKEIEALKSKLRDYQDKFANSFSYTDMKKLQSKLDAANEEIKKLKEDIIDYVIEKDDEVNELKKTQDWNKLNKNGVEKRTEKYYVCNHCGYKIANNLNHWDGCTMCDGLMVEKEEEQKHPMYPIHWGGLDPDILKQAQEQSIEEVVESLKGMKTQGFEDYDSTDFVKLSYDQSVKIAEMNAVQEKQREESRDKSWEEAASDLALRVVKLEKQIEELTLKNTNISYSAMNLDGTLKTINCSTTQPYKNWDKPTQEYDHL